MTETAERDIFINGRFLTRPVTGVERVATEILSALTTLLAERPDLSLHLKVIAPRMSAEQQKIAQAACDRLGLALIGSQTRGYLWEQVELPLRTLGAPVVSFCNIGPVLKRNQLVVIHDAQVYTQPVSYTWSFRAVYKALLPLLGRVSRHVVVVSENTKKELERFRVVPKGKAHVIHNAADHILAIRPAANEPVPPPYFLVFGSQAAHKNVATVLQAAARYSDREIPLVIAGGSNDRVFQNADAHESSGIIRLGRLSDESLVKLYSNATALLFPSLTEGFGIPPLEAMHLACPVIASDGGAIPEVCGNAALYVSPRDVDGWSNAMRKVANDPALREEMRDKGFERVRQFTWAAAASKYLEMIVDLVQPTLKRGPGYRATLDDQKTGNNQPT